MKGVTMKQLGRFQFPEQGNTAEIEQWQPWVTYRALHRQVLVVARTRIEGTWKAYCAPVAGEDHDVESHAVLRHGTAIEKDIAHVMFPEFENVPYAQ